MDVLTPLVAGIPSAALLGIFSLSAMTAIELLFSRAPQLLAGRLPGLLFWAIWLPVTTVTFAAFRLFWDWAGVPPLVTLPLTFSWSGAAAIVAAPVAGAILSDFFFYWFHRAQHAWFWKYHAAHHAIRDLNAVNSYHHISESAIQTVLMLVPASLIVADTGPIVPAMMVLLYVQATYLHSSSRLHFGPLARLVCDNRYHRIHHSVEERHFDRNFAAFTPLWDRVFGTIHVPAKDEWPDTGLAEIDQPRTVGEWLSVPARYAQATATTPEVPRSSGVLT